MGGSPTTQHYGLDVTVFIEGVPFVFGTRAGLSHPMTDMDGNTLTNMGATTSVSALVLEDLEIGRSVLDWDLLIMKPTTLSWAIPSSTTWDQYFMRRLPESFHADLTYAGTTINYPYAVDTPGATDGFADAQGYDGAVLYCGRESMLVTNVAGAPTYQLAVTRAYADFPGAQSIHPEGSLFQWSPTMWPGRRCEVRIWSGGTTQSVIYGVIQASPAFDKAKARWTFQATDTMAMLDRKIAVGFTGGDCTAKYRSTAVNGAPAVEVYPTTAWVDEVGDDTAAEPGHLLLTDSEGRSAAAPILDFINSGTRFVVDVPALLPEAICKARRFYLFKGSPMRAALTVLMSKAGGNSQSVTITGTEQPTGDRLFGQVHETADAEDTALTSGQEKRFGAAIHKLFLDVWSSLDSGDMAEAAREHVPGWAYALGLSGEEDLIGFLSEVAHAHRGFWFRNYKGQISFRLLKTDVPGTTAAGIQEFTATDAHLLRDGSWVSLDDESEAIGTQTIECNWHPVDGKYTATFNLMDMRVHALYRERANNTKAQRRGLYVSLPGRPRLDLPDGFDITPVPFDQLRTQMERLATYRNGGLRKYNIRLPWSFAPMQPGDRITLTSEHLIDFTGSGETLSAFKVMPLQVHADPKAGVVDAEVVEVRTGKILPPVLEVASYDAGTYTITLKTGGTLEWDEVNNLAPVDMVDASGGSYSSVLGALVLLDESATPPYSAETTLNVTSMTATTLTLSGAPSITPAAGDLIYPVLVNIPPQTAANIYGHTEDDFGAAQHYNDPTDMINGVPGYGVSLTIDGTDCPVRRWN